MQFISPTLLLIAAARLISADFIIANTTACYGEFLAGACTTNVQVISDGADYNASFTCDKLYHAQDYRHIYHNTAGPLGTNFTSRSDICGVDRLFFARNYTSTATNGTFDIYEGNDASGDSVGSCTYDGASEFKRRCSQLFGTIFYQGAYRCNTKICGSALTSSSSSGILTFTTLTASNSTFAPSTATSTSSGTATISATTTTIKDSSSAQSTAAGSSETAVESIATTSSNADTDTTTPTTQTEMETSPASSSTTAG